MLKNKLYTGEHRFQETVIENAFEPIVPKNLFERCQKRLENNKRISAHFAKNIIKYILTGKVYCGKRGSQLADVEKQIENMVSAYITEGCSPIHEREIDSVESRTEKSANISSPRKH